MSAIVRRVAGAFTKLLLASPVSAQPTRYAGHERQVLAIAFSPDGQWLATAGYDRTIHLWDLARGSAIALRIC